MKQGAFYKASKRVLARKDLTAAEKLVRIVRAHYRAFEGREPTTAEIARATGLEKRTVRRAKADKKSAPKRTKCPDKMSAQADKKSAPSCSKSYGSLRDVDKGGGDTAPPPSAMRGEEKGNKGDGTVAVLAVKARMGGGKWPFEQWAGQVQEDTAAGRYRRADLEAFVAGRTSITEAPWRLAESVRRHADAAKAAAFDARIREIRYGGLTRVEPVLGPNDARKPAGADVRYRVRWTDDGLLIIHTETLIGERWSDDGLAYRYEVRSLAAASRWRFRPYQPRLFE